MLGLPQTGVARPGRDERRLVERVLRHWTQLAARRRFPRVNEIDRWMTGDDRANCVLIAVQSPVELSHFSAVGENLAVALCLGTRWRACSYHICRGSCRPDAASSSRAGQRFEGCRSSIAARCSRYPKTATRSTMCWARRTIAPCPRTMRRVRSSFGRIGFRPRVPVRKPFLRRVCAGWVPPAALPSVIGGPGSDFIGSTTERGSGTR